MQERKYRIKDSWKFNLDSMRTSLMLIIYDMEDGLYTTKEIMGEEMDIDRVEQFKEEVEDLLTKAVCIGRVTGSEYGRIKEISDERNLWRYEKCIASGMSDYEAGYAFMD